jgi:hypothetical protein
MECKAMLLYLLDCGCPDLCNINTAHQTFSSRLLKYLLICLVLDSSPNAIPSKWNR